MKSQWVLTQRYLLRYSVRPTHAAVPCATLSPRVERANRGRRWASEFAHVLLATPWKRWLHSYYSQ
jgi:hypothetical protein